MKFLKRTAIGRTLSPSLLGSARPCEPMGRIFLMHVSACTPARALPCKRGQACPRRARSTLPAQYASSSEVRTSSQVDAEVVYCCSCCHAHLADHKAIISKAFQGRHGRAYLFDNVINVSPGPSENRLLLTGLHVCQWRAPLNQRSPLPRATTLP